MLVVVKFLHLVGIGVSSAGSNHEESRYFAMNYKEWDSRLANNRANPVFDDLDVKTHAKYRILGLCFWIIFFVVLALI